MALFKPADDETNIAPAQAAATSDEKPGETLSKKPENVNEKADWSVEVSQSAQTPAESRRQRYARLIRSMFTVKFIVQTGEVLWKFGKFTGPGAIISVAYIDPDNYQTAVSAGAEFKFKLLFMILFSNVVAVYLQVSMPGLYSRVGLTETGVVC
jgi:metal iron transporter